MNQIVPLGGAFRNAEPEHERHAVSNATGDLFTAQAIAAPVVLEARLVPLGRRTGRSELLRSAEAAIGRAALEQPIGVAPVLLESGALENHLFIPVQPQPAQPIEDGLRTFLGAAGPVRVLDAQQEDSSEPAGQQPVEESGSSASHVQEAGRGWSEAES